MATRSFLCTKFDITRQFTSYFRQLQILCSCLLTKTYTLMTCVSRSWQYICHNACRWDHDQRNKTHRPKTRSWRLRFKLKTRVQNLKLKTRSSKSRDSNHDHELKIKRLKPKTRRFKIKRFKLKIRHSKSRDSNSRSGTQNQEIQTQDQALEIKRFKPTFASLRLIKDSHRRQVGSNTSDSNPE